MKNRVDLVKAWIRKAENDLRTAVNTLETMKSPPVDTVCFHAQQCAEKYLKAYLVHKGISFPYIHHLERLAVLCATQDKEFENLISEVKPLSPYAAEARYPDAFSEILIDDAKKAVKVAQKVKLFVLDKLPDLPE